MESMSDIIADVTEHLRLKGFYIEPAEAVGIVAVIFGKHTGSDLGEDKFLLGEIVRLRTQRKMHGRIDNRGTDPTRS